MWHEYKKTISFAGDSRKAIEVAQSVFINNNFKIDFTSNSEVVAKSPGLRSTKQNPLLGATRVHIAVRSSFIELSADLGGVKWMRNFMFIFPPSLAFLLSMAFLFLSMPRFSILIPWLAISPWFVLSPLLTGWIKKRTVAALDTLLNNMKSLGQIG